MTAWQTYKKALVCAAILAFSSTCFADRLEQVIKEAVACNPEVLMRSAHKYAQASQVREATSGYLPRIDFLASYGRDHNKNFFTRLENPSGGDLTLTKSEAILSINQMLFDGFAVRSEVEAGTARDKSSAYHVLAKMDQVILEIVAAYIDTIMLRSIYMHAKDNLDYHQKIVDDISNRQSEKKRDGDLDFAKARLAVAQTIVLDLQRDIRNSQADYIKVVGKKPGIMYRPDAPEKVIPTSEEAVVSVAMNNNPVVFIANAEIQAARAEKRGAKSHYFPKLNLELSGSDNNNVDGYNQRTNSLSAMLYLTYNVFHGGKDIARERKSAWLLEETKESLNETLRVIEQDTRHVWSSYINYKGQLQYLKQQVESIDVTQNFYFKEFSKGDREIIDVLDSGSELFYAKSKYIYAQYKELFSRFMLLKSMGKIRSYFHVANPASVACQSGAWMNGY